MHLTVISYQSTLDGLFEEIAFAANAVWKERAFARCQGRDELVGCVRRAVFDVNQLDLVGHNREGEGFKLGDAVFLRRGETPPDFFKLLDLRLPKDATIRILGCETGVGVKGLEFLRSVSQVLGGREVIGTRCPLISLDFREGGLRPDFPEDWIVSSKDTTPRERVNRGKVSPEDSEFARRWEANLPPGYLAMGRGRPLARIEHRLPCRDVTLKLAFNNRLALVDDGTGREPLLLQWTRSERAPFWSHLLVPFTAR